LKNAFIERPPNLRRRIPQHGIPGYNAGSVDSNAKHLTIALTVLLFTFPGFSFGQSKAEMSLQKERSNLAGRTTGPVDRTKINIKISDR
jgi:hypothetical protein